MTDGEIVSSVLSITVEEERLLTHREICVATVAADLGNGREQQYDNVNGLSIGRGEIDPLPGDPDKKDRLC